MTLPKPVMAFLERHTTLTLATSTPHGTPAAAPLFFAVLPDGTLVFLSEEHTQHVQNLLRYPHVAVAIYQDGQSWETLWGVQARGEAFHLPADRQSAARDAYTRKFPFLQAVTRPGKVARALRGPLSRAHWFGIHLTWIRLIDNRRGFGWKAEWRRTPQGWEQIR